jgi:hypothetical protein
MAKYQCGNIVRFYRDNGTVGEGRISEVHPEGRSYLLTFPMRLEAEGWFREEQVFHRIAEGCADHKWIPWEMPHNMGLAICCRICGVRYADNG